MFISYNIAENTSDKDMICENNDCDNEKRKIIEKSLIKPSKSRFVQVSETFDEKTLIVGTGDFGNALAQSMKNPLIETSMNTIIQVSAKEFLAKSVD